MRPYPENPSNERSNSGSTELTRFDWLLCVLLPMVAFALGVVRGITGNPNWTRMVLVSSLAGVIWCVLYCLSCTPAIRYVLSGSS